MCVCVFAFTDAKERKGKSYLIIEMRRILGVSRNLFCVCLSVVGMKLESFQGENRIFGLVADFRALLALQGTITSSLSIKTTFDPLWLTFFTKVELMLVLKTFYCVHSVFLGSQTTGAFPTLYCLDKSDLFRPMISLQEQYWKVIKSHFPYILTLELIHTFAPCYFPFLIHTKTDFKGPIASCTNWRVTLVLVITQHIINMC